jgi:AraC-like DNA-binding protein
MPKNPIESASLRAVTAHLQALIGPDRPFATINAMASKLGMHPTTLRRYINHESDMTMTMLDFFSTSLGIPPATLIDPKGNGAAPADELVVECLNLLRSLPYEELIKVRQIIGVYVPSSEVGLEKRTRAATLADLTAAPAPSKAEQAREGVPASANRRHSRKGAR